ncbi:40S ribosomal protein S13 [Morus notabilis]|uniref:40S ribosomal protein S13 n=1 Tax=Morus notabilis TaxID=981085 RepID=W9RE52_9ROSA|nr:40S ribosomal protein S13 [Morus notabilis]
MDRMHSRGKGISASALPYKRTPPSWLKISSQDLASALVNRFVFSRSKQISASALPYKRTPPSWLKIFSQDEPLLDHKWWGVIISGSMFSQEIKFKGIHKHFR